MLVEDGHLTNRDEDKAEALDTFSLSQSSIILTDIQLPSPLSRRTTSAGAVTSYLWTPTP